MRRFVVLFGVASMILAGCGGGGTDNTNEYVAPTTLDGYIIERQVVSAYFDAGDPAVSGTTDAWIGEAMTSTANSQVVKFAWIDAGTSTTVTVGEVACEFEMSAVYTEIPGIDRLERIKVDNVGTRDTCGFGAVGVAMEAANATAKKDASGAPSMYVEWVPEGDYAEPTPTVNTWADGGGPAVPRVVCPKDAVMGDAGCVPFCYFPMEGDPYVEGGGKCPQTVAEL